MGLFRKLAVTCTAATFALIGVGGLVRATGSGDACPDWPTCHGGWIPPLEYHVVIEYSHRLLASVVVILVAALAVVALRRLRHVRQAVRPALAAVFLVVFQAALGGVVVKGDLHAALVTAHFATAMLLFGLLVHLTVRSFSLTSLPSNGQPVQGSDPVFARLALIAAGATFALLLMGAYARGEGAGLAFPDWPLMDGRLIPDLGGPATAHFLHRAGAAAVGVLVLYVAVRSWRMPSRSADLVALATGAAALFVVQVFVGAASVWTELAAPAVVAHVAISALIWGTLVALASVSRRLARGPASEPVDTTPARASLGRATASYFQLTKPRIVVLLLVTTVPTMVLAARGVPSLWLVAATLLGGSVAAGGANAINCYLDRDIDEVMRRTRSRPLPAGRVTPEDALTFGLALGAVSFVWLSLSVNVLAALLSLSAILFYVLVYTAWLKRSTPQNIVIGGAAGAVPVLVGWAAVTGSVGPPALVLFAIVFLWTPPHFWALALRHTKEYAAARIPMLPVVKGERRTTRSILAYSVVLVATTLLLYPVAHMGAIYLAAAVGLGGVLVHRAWRLRRNLSPALAWGLFKFSISYLGLLFAAVAVDRLLPIGI